MNKRKQKALKIAEKQEYDEKRNRLLHVLVQKLLLNFGPKTEKALSKGQISEVVNSYLERIPSIVNVTNIRKVDDLELELSKELKNTRRRQVKVKPPSKRSSANNFEVHSRGSCNATSNSSQSIPKNSLEQINVTANQVNPWTMIETFQLVENEESGEEKKVKAVHKRKDMAAALHEQIRIKKQAAEEEKADDDKFLEIQRNAIKEWEEEQISAAKVEREKITELKKVRQKQVEETERKRKAQLADKMSCELKEIEEIQFALEKEEQSKHHNKQLEREKWERITVENMEKKKYRQRQKEEEARMDAKLMENMRIKYDNEEKKRAKEIEDRKIKLEVNGQLLSEAGAFKKREEMIKFEKSLLEAAEARERAQALREKKKHDIERKKKDLIRETNEQMAQERRRREKEIEKENEAYALKCLKEKEALLEEEEASRIKQHETKERYRMDLEKQMDEQRKHQADFDGMTVVERSMNKKLMEKLENPQVKKKIIDKVLSSSNNFNRDEI